MKRILNTMIMLTALTTVGAFAQGNGSGNPKNDPYNTMQRDITPRFVWKDGKLVGNPAYITYKGDPKDLKHTENENNQDVKE